MGYPLTKFDPDDILIHRRLRKRMFVLKLDYTTNVKKAKQYLSSLVGDPDDYHTLIESMTKLLFSFDRNMLILNGHVSGGTTTFIKMFIGEFVNYELSVPSWENIQLNVDVWKELNKIIWLGETTIPSSELITNILNCSFDPKYKLSGDHRGLRLIYTTNEMAFKHNFETHSHDFLHEELLDCVKIIEFPHWFRPPNPVHITNLQNQDKNQIYSILDPCRNNKYLDDDN